MCYTLRKCRFGVFSAGRRNAATSSLSSSPSVAVVVVCCVVVGRVVVVVVVSHTSYSIPWLGLLVFGHRCRCRTRPVLAFYCCFILVNTRRCRCRRRSRWRSHSQRWRNRFNLTMAGSDVRCRTPKTKKVYYLRMPDVLTSVFVQSLL